MKFEEVLPALRDGKKVRRQPWDTDVCITSTNLGSISAKSLMENDWEVYEEPKKPRLLAHAIRKQCGMYSLSTNMYDSEDSARKVLLGTFHSWPAVPNAEGFYSLEGK
jgi:hypothetical protein